MICQSAQFAKCTGQFAVVYVDFAKAFDVVSHKKLFTQLFSYGLCGCVLLRMQNFFAERTHQTKVGTCLSDPVGLVNDLVQGSGIGLIMFLVYINELAVILTQFPCISVICTVWNA